MPRDKTIPDNGWRLTPGWVLYILVWLAVGVCTVGILWSDPNDTDPGARWFGTAFWIVALSVAAFAFACWAADDFLIDKTEKKPHDDLAKRLAERAPIGEVGMPLGMYRVEELPPCPPPFDYDAE